MALVDYSLDPATGLYDFRDDAGRSRMAFGPEAEELARFVDQTRGPRLAANMSGGGPAMSSAPEPPPPPGAQMGPPGPPTTATDAQSGVGSYYGGPQGESMFSPEEKQAFQAAYTSPRQAAQQAVASEQEPPSAVSNEDVIRFINAPVYQPGRAAFDPEAEAAARKPVPVARTVQTTGGLAETPEQKAERIEAEKQRKAAQKSALENVRAANEARVAAAEDAKWSHLADAENKAAAIEEKRKERAKIQEHGAKGRAKLEADIQNIRSRKIDDKRIFRGKDGEINTGSVIASALAMGLGAFGAGMTGTRNFAQDLIEGAIQQDIQLQKDQIEREGDAADNALARLIRHNRFTESEATRALEILQREQAQAKAAALAAQMGTAEAQAKAEQINLELMQRNEEANARFQEMYGGRQVVTEQQQMMAPRAGSAGGYRAPTLKEKSERLKFGGDLKDLVDPKLKPEEANAKLAGQKFALERRVTLDDGNFAWATTKERADKSQAQIDAANQYKRNVQRQREILNKAGDSVDPELREEYNSLVQQNTLLLKETEDLGAITEADQQMVTPLTGEGGQSFTRFKSGVMSSSKSAEQHVDFRLRSAKKQLFQEPEAKTLITPTEKSLGIREGR